MPQMQISGIYSIVCAVSGRAYIGSSVRIHYRWKQHLSSLRAGKHHSIFLQRAWNKNGEQNFRFSIVEICDKSDLIERENFHIDTHRLDVGVFNAAPAAGSTRGLVKGPMPEEIRAKISNTHKGMKHTDAAKIKMSASGRARAPISEETRNKFIAHMTGRKLRPLSAEHRAAISAVHKGKVISEEHRAALSLAHKGRPLSDEHKRKKSEAAKRQHARQREARERAKLQSMPDITG